MAEKRRSTYKPIGTFLLLSPFEALNFASIFTMLHFCADILFAVPIRFIVFPAAALFGLSKAGALWHNFALIYEENKRKLNARDKEERGKVREKVNIAFLQALWETLNSLGTTGAVIAGIVGFFTGAAVGMGISITFATLLSISTVICLAYAVYFGVTASSVKKKWDALPEDEKTEEHPLYKEYLERKSQALQNLRFFGIVALLTIGCGLAFIGGLTLPGAIIGVTGCLLAAGYSAYNYYQFRKAGQKETQETALLLDDANAQNKQQNGALLVLLRTPASNKRNNPLAKKSLAERREVKQFNQRRGSANTSSAALFSIGNKQLQNENLTTTAPAKKRIK